MDIGQKWLVIRRYSSEVTAQELARYLQAHCIEAKVEEDAGQLIFKWAVLAPKLMKRKSWMMADKFEAGKAAGYEF